MNPSMNPFTDRNRMNAKFSTGPKTPQGKQTSAQNATVHGLYSQSALLPSEDADRYRAHVAAYMAELKPNGPLQTDLAEVVADSMWRLRRIRKLEAENADALSLCEYNLSKMLTPEMIQQTVALARALEMLGRHEVRIQNAMHKALKELKALQAQENPKPAVVPAPKTEAGFVPTPEFSTAAAAADSIPQPAPENIRSASPEEQKHAA